jgi:hypothetical protein
MKKQTIGLLSITINIQYKRRSGCFDKVIIHLAQHEYVGIITSIQMSCPVHVYVLSTGQ